MTRIGEKNSSQLIARVRERYESVHDWFEVLLRLRDPLTPPDRLIFVGGDHTNFRQLGDKWLRAFIDLCSLEPHERVLDVGCGIGRMAVALTQYLNRNGSYEGFDIVGPGIEWCRKQITSRFSNFRFCEADVFNRHYKPTGRFKASEYRFPYEDEDFDFVFLTSVFTHMFQPDVENYLAEVRRVMRSGGRCLITFFLLNEDSLSRLEKNEAKPGRNFLYEIEGGCRTINKDMAESAIAYPEKTVKAMYESCALNITGVFYGGWCGRPGSHFSQDIVVACKNN
jgi:ubiquinone/menaquinone biosynthesis C-methylase UbiE